MTSVLKIAAGLALAYAAAGTPALAVALLYVDGSNPLLFDCIAFWLRRLLPVFHFAVERNLIPLGTFLSHYANIYLQSAGYASAADVLETSPLHHVVCYEIVTFTGDLIAYYKSRQPQTESLCPNGDHSNVEETLIIVREHVQKIAGAVLTALFLSAFVAYMSSLSVSTGASTSATPAATPLAEYVPPTFDEVFRTRAASAPNSWGSVETVYSMTVDSASQTASVNAESQTEPVDPSLDADSDSDAITVLIYLNKTPRYDVDADVDAGLSIADARKAMRSNRDAFAEQAAAAILAAVRRRIQRENAAADGLDVEVVNL